MNGTVAAMPRFRIGNLLVLTVVFAVTLAALVRPSLNWCLLLPVVGLLLCSYGVSRAVLVPIDRAFWLSFIAGLFAYAAIATGVRWFYFASYGPSWQDHTMVIELLAWKLIHGRVPYSNTILNGYSVEHVVSFAICLNAAFALLLSAITAYAAEVMISRRTQDF